MKYLYIALLILLIPAAPANAGVVGSTGTNLPKQERLSPEQLASARYKAGKKHHVKAMDLEQKVHNEKNDKKAAGLQSKAEKEYAKAIRDFEKAIKLWPRHYSAHKGLGKALREVGRHEESLKAYNESLRINPNYAEAIKNRAEAYLDLNRIEDAKQAYLSLREIEPDQANQLLAAMMDWVASRRGNGGDNTEGVDQQTIDQFADWLQRRDEFAS